MPRKERSTYKNNIVIVCEGSDTEPYYLEDLSKYLSKRYAQIRIVPFNDEARKASQRDASIKKALRNTSRKERSTNLPKGMGAGNFYWVKEEQDEELYKLYSPQPTRYVREAQLFMQDGYVEAWAVYDHDKFPDHEKARELAAHKQFKVNIAFSSVSFEEWLLLHFERNPKAFSRSCCKENKKDIGCGDGKSNHPKDCHGRLCIAGYLREKKYIPDFHKSGQGYYSRYTKDHIPLVRINAAWVRTLADTSTPVYERNPYTDFDLMLAHVLGLTDRYTWIGDSETAIIGHTRVSISHDEEASEISITNIGKSTLLGKIFRLNDNGEPTGEKIKLLLYSGQCIKLQYIKNSYLCIEIADTDKYIICIENKATESQLAHTQISHK